MCRGIRTGELQYKHWHPFVDDQMFSCMSFFLLVVFDNFIKILFWLKGTVSVR